MGDKILDDAQVHALPFSAAMRAMADKLRALADDLDSGVVALAKDPHGYPPLLFMVNNGNGVDRLVSDVYFASVVPEKAQQH